MLTYLEDGQACLFDLVFCAGKMFQAHSPAGFPKEKISGLSLKKSSELVSLPYMFLDLSEDAGNLLGESYWETLSPWRGDALMLNTGVSPREENESSLWQILEDQPHSKYYLTRKACRGILRRAKERGKELPRQLENALAIQAGDKLMSDNENASTEHAVGYDPYAGDISGDVAPTLGVNCGVSTGRNGVLNLTAFAQNQREADCSLSERKAYHINQRNEGIDLNGVSGALMATQNMQMQTFVTEKIEPIAFAANQRNEVRDLHNVSAALCAHPSVKQQTFIAEGVVIKGDGTCLLAEETHTSLTSGEGQAGQEYPSILTKEKIQEPDVMDEHNAQQILCLNDQGGQFMSCSENVVGTLRSQMHGHPPVLLESNQNHAAIRTDGISTTLPAAMGMGGGYVPMIYENHGKDARYKGPLKVAPTMSAAYGTGGNNVPLVERSPQAFCIMGNAIDRQPENGGNGMGCQADVAYTLTSTDRHAVFSRQRVDLFQKNDVVSTESARQHKDATDLVIQPYQRAVGTLGYTDHKGINNQYVGEDKCVIEGPNLIRRLTPLECERLQGFPDHWTDIPGASDSSRYKALGNSVAVPCVDFVLNGIRLAIETENKTHQP